MLFDISKPSYHTSDVFIGASNPADYISSQDAYLGTYLKGIDFNQPEKMVHFTSNGRFALHDLVIFFARKLDKADCMVTSFNLSVKAANAFLRAYDNRQFSSLQLVLNAQKKSNFKEAVKLLDGKFPMVFKSIHAKVALITNGQQFFSIVTTGNLSSNNNIERGFISTDKRLYDYDKRWIDSLFE